MVSGGATGVGDSYTGSVSRRFVCLFFVFVQGSAGLMVVFHFLCEKVLFLLKYCWLALGKVLYNGTE